MRFIGFISHLAVRADEVVRVARKALAGEEEQVDFADLEERGALAELRRSRQLILEMTLARAVDNFLAYLTELLAVAYRTRPEMLLSRLRDSESRRGRESETVPLELVLEHSTIDDLVDALVERRVTALAYRGMRDVADYLDQQLGLRLFESSDELSRAVELVEQRNLITHNRSVINRVFLSRVPNPTRYTLGAPLVLDVDTVFDDAEFLARAALSIDARAVEKWNLATESFAVLPT